MSLRATFLLLLFANLAFFGWAALIDVPSEPTQSDGIGNLPKLKLLSEVHGKPSSAGPAAVPGSSASKSADPPAAGSSASAAVSTVSAGSQPTGDASTGSGPNAAASASARLASVTPGPSTASPAPADVSRRCITIGPFGDPERAREAADVLRERGFAPRGRTAASRAVQGYWVFIDGLRSPADETSVLERLKSNGIADAKAMPVSDADRRISVGLFNARVGAERRASAVRRLGLKAQVEARPAEEAWVDVDLDSSSQSLPAEGLLSLEEPGSRLEIKECPAPVRGTGSRILTAAGRRPAG